MTAHVRWSSDRYGSTPDTMHRTLRQIRQREVPRRRRRDRAAAARLPDDAGLPVLGQRPQEPAADTGAHQHCREVEVVAAIGDARPLVRRGVRPWIAARDVFDRHRIGVADVPRAAGFPFVGALAVGVVGAGAPAAREALGQAEAHALIPAAGVIVELRDGVGGVVLALRRVQQRQQRSRLPVRSGHVRARACGSERVLSRLTVARDVHRPGSLRSRTRCASIGSPCR